MSPKIKKDKKGFTLVELLVVILIIGVFAAIALPQYFKALDKARFVQVQTFVESLVRAEQSYFLLNNDYPLNMGALDVDIPEKANCILKYTSGGGVAGCYLYKNNKVFIFFRKNFSGSMVGLELCCSYAATNFAGEDLCLSITKATTKYSDTENYHCYKKVK